MKKLFLLCSLVLNIYCFNSNANNTGGYEFNYQSAIQKQQEHISTIINRIEKLENELKELREILHIKKVEEQNNEVNNNEVTKNEVTKNDKQDYDNALMKLKTGKLKESEKEFEEFINKYTSSNFLDHAMFWYAESIFRQKDFSRAAKKYLESYNKFPKGSKASDSLLKLSYSLFKTNQNKKACKVLGKLNKEFPNLDEVSKKRAKQAAEKFGCNL